jgi:hypothetical protein
MKQLSFDEQARRGEAVARLLGDPNIRELLRAIDEQYIAEWKDRESTPESRERVWHKAQAFHDLLEELERVVSEGVFARETLQRHERQAP